MLGMCFMRFVIVGSGQNFAMLLSLRYGSPQIEGINPINGLLIKFVRKNERKQSLVYSEFELNNMLVKL